MKRFILLLTIICLIDACKKSEVATIKGQFHGAANKLVVLERLSPSGNTIADTVQTSSDGRFKFEIDFTDIAEPTFYNVRLDNNFVPLLIDRGENIELSSIGNIFLNYKVSGSKGSDAIKNFNDNIVQSQLKLDSLSSMYGIQPSPELGREFAREYAKMKQKAIVFMLKNANSLAVVVPLLRPLQNGNLLFDAAGDDIIYFRAIADSIAKYHPNSQYLQSLRNDIQDIDRIYSKDSIVNNMMDSGLLNFPEIKNRNAAGKMVALSQIVSDNKVVLLSFTSLSEAALKVLNREFVAVYDKYHDKGFEIFEVSIDTDKAAWLRSVTDGKLPWIQVCDFLGATSPDVLSYNVQRLPANFLISNDGDIIGKNLSAEQLSQKLQNLLK